MRVLASVVAASLAVSDAGLLVAYDGGRQVDYQCPDAPLAERIDGGWVVSDARDERLHCLQAACERHRDELLAAVEKGEEPTPAVLTAVGLIGVAIGIALAEGFRLLVTKK